MGIPFSSFSDGETPRVTDIGVGLRGDFNFKWELNGINANDGYPILSYNGVTTGVNSIAFSNAVTGSAPTITTQSFESTDTDVDLSLNFAGEGALRVIGTNAMYIPYGTTAQRPAGPTGVDGGFRYNTDTDYLEYWDNSSNSWVIVIAGAAFDTATYITKTDETADLPNSQPLSALATGFMYSTTATGVVGTRTLTGTTNTITVANGTGAAGNPTFTLSSTLVFPGTATLSNGNSLTFYDAGDTNYARFQAPIAGYNASAVYQLPVDVPPASGYVLTSSGTGVMSWVLASVGDVVGPASSVDNRVVRFDGTTGKLIQSSVVSINDSGDYTSSGSLQASSLTATVGNVSAAANITATAGTVTTSGGTVSAPAYTFNGKTNTGMYSSSARGVDFTGGGTRLLALTAPVSAVNYLQISASATGSGITMTTAGTDADVDLIYTGKASNSKLVITRTGSITAPTISNSVGTTGISFPSSGRVTIVGGGTTALDVRQSVGSANNFIQIFNADSTSPLITVDGAGAGTGLDVLIAGNGAGGGLGVLGDFTASTSGIIKIFETDNTDYVAFQAPDPLVSSTTYTLPDDYPAVSGYVLSSTDAGVMSWVANTAGAVNSGVAGQLAYYDTTGSVVSGGQLDNVLGTDTNDDAPAGYVGEFVSSVIAASGAISLTDNVDTNVTSISLTAGDWEVYGNVFFTQSATGNVVYGWSSATSATLPDISLIAGTLSDLSGSLVGVTIPTRRFSLASTTTIYLSVRSSFSSGTSNVCGGIYARRVR